MCLFGQLALKVRLAASSKLDGNEWAWALTLLQQPTAAAVWDERTCEVAVSTAQIFVYFSELVFAALINTQ